MAKRTDAERKAALGIKDDGPNADKEVLSILEDIRAVLEQIRDK